MQKSLKSMLVASALGVGGIFQGIAMADDQSATAESSDPLIWMEEVEGEAALDWVRAQNDRSLADIMADPRFDDLKQIALDVVNDAERIPSITYRDGMVYNFWQDETNVRGLWRRTTLESYLSDETEWDILLDFDALSEAEDANWVFKGASGLSGTSKYMVSLSDGGKDAVVRREYDIDSKEWVEGGFVTPESKGGTTWVDENTILVAIDFGDGTLTKSGYPFIVKKWTRGTPIEEAETVIKGEETDVGVFSFSMENADGREIFASEADTFFTTTYWYLGGETPVKLPLPPKSSIQGLFEGEIIATLEESWTVGETVFPQGALVALDFEDATSGTEIPKVSQIFAPGERESIESVTTTASKVLVMIYENVIGTAYAYELGEESWTRTKLPLPDKGAVNVMSANYTSDTAFIMQESFIAPDTLFKVDVTENTALPAKALSEKFASENLVVDQYEATSKDGTKVPYFVVHQRDIPLDGTTPTLQYAYGGFQVSMNPSYSANIGKMWLEKGGAYILANIRGGGEFGPAWHQAGLKTKRQVVYDDFQAVAEDAIARGITSPEKLGIMGGSNGGLLMGVSLVQRPDLWNAVVVQVPLLDMLRYHLLLAGASWIDEYGDPDVPEEREWLEKMSPYANFDAGADYPTPFFVTSTKDDRVHPAHARKMAKLFEESGKPFFYYENIDGGHSAAANLQEAAKRRALEFTYLHQQLFGPAEAEE